MCLHVVIDNAVLEPAVYGFDDDVYDGVGAEGEVADFADLNLLVVFDVLEMHEDFVLADGQEVVVSGGLLGELHDAGSFFVYQLEAELLETVYQHRLGVVVKF